MIKARNVKWGMGSPTSPPPRLAILSILTDIVILPAKLHHVGDGADFEVQIVSQMSETKTDDMRGDLCHPCSKL